MSVLQMCWLAVTGATIVFLIVAAISALPKMKAAYTASIAAIFLGSSGITAFGGIVPVLSHVGLAPPAAALGLVPPAHLAPLRLPPPPVPGAPLANDASAGKVVFTFDDGPDTHTPAVISELNALHVKGVFFVIGVKAAAHPEMIRAEVANGDVVGNHTWSHPSLTGKSTGTRPLTQAQVREQLSRANAAIVMAGAPEPTLWRPPYGGVNGADVATARVLGLRVVLDSGDNIIDSNDWAGMSAKQIAARVTPVLRDKTIVAFHDGLKTASPTTIAALPLIVAYMNAHHLGATTAVRPDATGGCCTSPGQDRQRQATETTATAVPAAAAPAGAAPALAAPAAAGAAPVPTHGKPAPVPTRAKPAPVPTSTKPTPVPTTTPPAPAPSPTTPAPAPSTPAPTTPTATTAPAPEQSSASSEGAL